MWPEGISLAELHAAAMAGLMQAWVVALALALTTLLIEDLAIAAGAAFAAKGVISWELAFFAVAGGIALGDIGLYGLGLAAQRLPRLRPRLAARSRPWMREQLDRRLPSAILLARVVPGLRLVTYTACGYWRVGGVRFAAWVLGAVTLWTAGLFWCTAALGGWIAREWQIPVPVAVAAPILFLAVLMPLLQRVWPGARR